MADDLLTIEQFGATVKAKYPDYAEVPDAELGARMLQKYPEYGDRVTPFTARGGMTNPAMASPEVFRTTNLKDASGAAVVRPEDADPNTIGTLAAHTWQQADPGNLVRAGAQLVTHPVETPKSIGLAQVTPLYRARDAYRAGDYPTMVRHLINYMIPFAGPGLDKSADEMQAGQYAAGVGDAIGIGLSLFGPQKIGEAASAQYPLAAQATTAQAAGAVTPSARQAAVAAGRAEGVPVPVATATGNDALLGLQALSGKSLGGSILARRAADRTAQAMAQWGERLADEVAPAVTPEQAGRALEQSLVGTISQKAGTATEAYSGLRALEADPQYAAEVPAPKASADAQAAVAQRMRSALGYAPNTGELAELRRMAEEMGALPYVKRTWTDVTDAYGKQGNAGVGDLDIVAGAAGAPVYDDILKSLRSSDYVPTRNHVERMIRDTLETGQVNEVSRAAFDVAQRRLANDPAISKPSLPPSAGVVPEAPPVSMGMPVALKPLQDAMRPDYARLMAEAQVAPLMGSKAEAARTLSRLMQAPEWVPVSVADSVLGELKNVSRADVPALRTEGQAVAAKAVQTLSQQVDEIVSQVPGASELLARGRQATVEKYGVAQVRDQLKANPVGMFKELTAPNNSGLHLLRQVAAEAPEAVPAIARAKLEELLAFGPDKAAGEWGKLKPETRAILLPEAAHRAAVDRFFTLGKLLAANPNPSGSALTGWQGAELAMLVKNPAVGIPYSLGQTALAGVLYSPTTTAALTRFLEASQRVAQGAAKGAALEAAWANVAQAAQRAGIAGVPFRLPAAGLIQRAGPLAAPGAATAGPDRPTPPRASTR